MNIILCDSLRVSKGFLTMTTLINRTNFTSNYSVLPNSIPSNTSLSAHARLALIYLLGKPPTWKMRITDVKRAIGCGINKAYRCLNELIKAGYAKMIRGQSRVDWFFYDTPQTSANTDRDGFHHDGNGDELSNTEFIEKTESNYATHTCARQKEQNVVVNAGAENGPPIPDTLKGSQAKAAKTLLSSLPVPVDFASVPGFALCRPRPVRRAHDAHGGWI